MGATATGRTIVAQGDLSPNRHKEYPADAALSPGHLIKMNSTSEVLKHATAGGWARKLFAKENAIVGDLTTTAYAAADVVPCHDALPGDLINARVAAGALAITVADPLVSAGDGTLQKALVTGASLYSATADSTAVTNNNTITAYDVSYTIPAGLLRAGDLIRITGLVLAATVAGGTLTITVKIGSTAALVSGVPVSVANDVCYFFCEIKIRTVGNSGTLVASGFSFNGTPAAAASAADIPAPFNLLSTAVNTNATQAITVNSTWSTTSTTSTTLKDFNVELIRTAKDVVLAVAEETYDNSAGSDEAFILARII